MTPRVTPATPGAAAMSGRRDLRWVWLASEVLLVATSVASVLMLERIFSDDSFVAPIIFTLLVAHGVLIAARWFGFGTFTSSILSLAATGAAIVAIHYSSSAIAAVVPTSATIDQFRLDMTQAQELFQGTTTPVPPVTGFLVIASIGLWVICFSADWAAFRLFAPGQAMIPFVAILVFVSMLGTDDRRLETTSTALVCAVLFLLAHRSAARAAQGVWLDQGPGRGYVSMMLAGAILAVIAALAGILGGPVVPGANEAPLVELGADAREENRPLEVISPLVQIQPRLIDQSDQILFTVETNQRAYWRIAALDVFDGSLWRSQGQFRSAGDSLPVDYPSSAPVDSVNSTFDLGQLNVVWAPAAYLPTRFENLTSDAAGVNYESESATFIVDTNDQRTSDGLVYTVTSQIPRFTADSLRELAATNTQTVDARYLDLPADFSPLARQTAEQLTAGMTSPYDKAIALQDYFRQNFTYDVDVAKGHNIERIEDFLTIQRGYCEQFAGTYAAMARAVGLPARVATGFTPGDPDPDNPNRYIVRGKHAHAWPEVFIAGAGWVAFEPTPGRGAPNATEYTGVPESQDSFDSGTDQQEETPATPEELAAQAAAAPTPTPQPSDPEFEPPPEDELTPEELELVDQGSDSNAMRNIILAVLFIAAWAIGVPALKRWRTQRRLQRVGTDTRRRVTLAWASAVDFLETRDRSPVDAETLQEYADRVQRELPELHPAFGELTKLAVEAAYRPVLPDDAQADRAEHLSREIVRTIAAGQPWPVRGARELDPRPLVKINDPVAALADRLATGAHAGG